MRKNLEKVILAESDFMIKNKATVREVAREFGISKTVIWKDFTVKLKEIDPERYKKVQAILEQNKQERAMRGGLATKRKWEVLSKK